MCCYVVSCVYRYDPQTDVWTAVAPMSISRDAVGVCLLGDRLYAVGGYDGQVYLNTVEAYDPQTNEWTQVRTQLFTQKKMIQRSILLLFIHRCIQYRWTYVIDMSARNKSGFVPIKLFHVHTQSQFDLLRLPPGTSRYVFTVM